MTIRRPITRLLLMAGFLAIASVAAPSDSATPATSPSAQISRLDSIRPMEVRLRKLHLVRPDLIPYPIEYEVVC
jgi:hypothetical protein